MTDLDLMVRCRYCGARIQERCRTGGNRVLWESHACRRRAAIKRAAARNQTWGRGELFRRADVLAVRDGAPTVYESMLSMFRDVRSPRFIVNVVAVCIDAVHATKGEPVAVEVLSRFVNEHSVRYTMMMKLNAFRDLFLPLGGEVVRQRELQLACVGACDWRSLSDAQRLFVQRVTTGEPENEILRAARSRIMASEERAIA